jgi:ribosomal protein L13E
MSDAAIVSTGPIDLVGRKCRPVRAEGYSPLELARAGLTPEKARRLGIPVDPGRSTGVGANVLLLRRLLAGR